MPVSLLIAIAAAAVLLLLCILFYIEAKRGRRLFLSKWRRGFDMLVQRGERKYTGMTRSIGSGTVRIIFLYALHAVLGFFAKALRSLEARVRRLQHRNRSVAKSIQVTQTSSHLNTIAEHKAATSLSEKEKAALKNKHLKG